MRQLRKTDDGAGYCDSLDQGRRDWTPCVNHTPLASGSTLVLVDRRVDISVL